MTKIFCDMCGNIVETIDVRYVIMRKDSDEMISEIVFPEQEICVACAEGVKEYITKQKER